MGNGETGNNSEWLYRKNIEFISSKINTLLQLRYQLAFVIISVIAVIWTILGSAYSQTIKDSSSSNDIFTFIFLGFILTIIVITIWRYFTHIISEEEHTTLITSFFSMYVLKNLKDFYQIEENCLWNDTLPTHLEKALKLNDMQDYNKILKSFGEDPRKDLFRINVLRKNQGYLPDDGIVKFDYFICCFFIILAIGFIGYIILGGVIGIDQNLLGISTFNILNFILSIFGLVTALLGFCIVQFFKQKMTPSNHHDEILAGMIKAKNEVTAYYDLKIPD